MKINWLEKISPRFRILWHGSDPPGHIEPPRRLYDHELLTVTEGECSFKFARKIFRCSAGYYIIIPPDVLHCQVASAESGFHGFAFHFDWTYIDHPPPSAHCVYHPKCMPPSLVRKTPAFVPRALFYGKINSSEPATEILNKIGNRWVSRSSFQHASCQALFLELLLAILMPCSSTSAGTNRQERLAREISSILNRTIPENHSVQELLKDTGYSYAHACRIFHRIYGISPLEYRHSLQIERAKQLLLNPRYNISQVANEIGFKSAQYFSHFFRQHTGTSPSDFDE